MAKKKGKYADIIDKLPRSLGTEPEYQDKVNAVKESMISTKPAPGDGQVNIEAMVYQKMESVKNGLSELADLLILLSGGKQHASVLARAYRRTRWVKDVIEEEEYKINMILEAYKQLVVSQYEVEGMKSWTMETGDIIRVQREPYAKVVNKDELRDWAIKKGYKGLLTLPWQTVNALTKQLLLDGFNEPNGVVAESRDKIVLTKG